MGLRNYDMKGGERQRLMDEASVVAKDEEGLAGAAHEVGLNDAIVRAVLNQPETFIDRRGPDQRHLAVFYPLAATLIELGRRIAGGPAQRCAGDVLGAQ